MKRNLSIALLFLAAAGFAAAQILRRRPTFSALTSTTAAVARPVTHHTAAHTATAMPKTADPTSGNIALWGEDVGSLYGKTITTGQSEHGSVRHTCPPALRPGRLTLPACSCA